LQIDTNEKIGVSTQENGLIQFKASSDIIKLLLKIDKVTTPDVNLAVSPPEVNLDSSQSGDKIKFLSIFNCRNETAKQIQSPSPLISDNNLLNKIMGNLFL
jgi:hypothetical protein